MDHFKLVIGDCYLRWVRDSLAHHLSLLETDGQSKVLAGFTKTSHQLLEFLFSVSYDSCFKSRRSVNYVLAMAFSLARLNSFPSDLVLR